MNGHYSLKKKNKIMYNFTKNPKKTSKDKKVNNHHNHIFKKEKLLMIYLILMIKNISMNKLIFQQMKNSKITKKIIVMMI